ncbi:Imidazolonepropionase [Frankliniella fusca]|uniref:Imidazolonepropionase n=1 Tax=Frankliniella fusca TaxID=407009 RepID=A0AAE1GYN0_9NEOP|nr:Imidazolonepropionase [Frankliniella fusca]
MFNFTVFDTRLKEGHCYIWTETDGHKGPNEIGTSLLDFIDKKVSEGIKEFSFYSDAPTGQNRNRMIFSMYLFASAKYKVNIHHRYNFRDELSSLEVTMKTGVMPDMASFQFPYAYSGKFPLSKNKASDIRELCKKHAIPTQYHNVYESYLNIQEATNADDEADE